MLYNCYTTLYNCYNNITTMLFWKQSQGKHLCMLNAHTYFSYALQFSDGCTHNIELKDMAD